IFIEPNGFYAYTPNAGFIGKDYFEYEVCNSTGFFDTALVTISVIREAITGKNRPPLAVEDNYKGINGRPVYGNLISNDFDPDDDGISISPVLATSQISGTLHINSDGTFSFLAADGFTGTIEF